MRCILCDRCSKIVEDERKIKVVTYARPLSTGAKSPTRADDKQINEEIWTKELCPSCAEELEDFMEKSAALSESTETDQPGEPGKGSEPSDTDESAI